MTSPPPLDILGPGVPGCEFKFPWHRYRVLWEVTLSPKEAYKKILSEKGLAELLEIQNHLSELKGYFEHDWNAIRVKLQTLFKDEEIDWEDIPDFDDLNGGEMDARTRKVIEENLTLYVAILDYSQILIRANGSLSYREDVLRDLIVDYSLHGARFIDMSDPVEQKRASEGEHAVIKWTGSKKQRDVFAHLLQRRGLIPSENDSDLLVQKHFRMEGEDEIIL